MTPTRFKPTLRHDTTYYIMVRAVRALPEPHVTLPSRMTDEHTFLRKLIRNMDDAEEIIQEAVEGGLNVAMMGQPEVLVDIVVRMYGVTDTAARILTKYVNINCVCREASYCLGRIATLLDSLEDGEGQPTYRGAAQLLRQMGALRAEDMPRDVLLDDYNLDPVYAEWPLPVPRR